MEKWREIDNSRASKFNAVLKLRTLTTPSPLSPQPVRIPQLGNVRSLTSVHRDWDHEVGLRGHAKFRLTGNLVKLINQNLMRSYQSGSRRVISTHLPFFFRHTTTAVEASLTENAETQTTKHQAVQK